MRAVEDGLPTLLVYFFEPSIMEGPDGDVRHWRFVQESIKDLNHLLSPNSKIYAARGEVIESLEILSQYFRIKKIFSHEETGNALTYQRDKDVSAFCAKHHIIWNEYPTNGIVRRLYHRRDFNKRWLETMNEPE
ncbi:MAG: deoxyribodipyrimidine photolyase, partial [Flammeovirgaceae bacterium]